MQWAWGAQFYFPKDYVSIREEKSISNILTKIASLQCQINISLKMFNIGGEIIVKWGSGFKTTMFTLEGFLNSYMHRGRHITNKPILTVEVLDQFMLN